MNMNIKNIIKKIIFKLITKVFNKTFLIKFFFKFFFTSIIIKNFLNIFFKEDIVFCNGSIKFIKLYTKEEKLELLNLFAQTLINNNKKDNLIFQGNLETFLCDDLLQINDLDFLKNKLLDYINSNTIVIVEDNNNNINIINNNINIFDIMYEYPITCVSVVIIFVIIC